MVRGLGGRVSVSDKIGSYTKNGVKVECQKVYRLHISFRKETGVVPFRLDRKQKLFRCTYRLKERFILGVKYIGDVESVCIQVDSDSHLYITDSHIVTHNTYMQAATYAAYNKLNTILAIPLTAIALQTHKKFEELFPDKHIGLVADGCCSVSEDITITTLKSLERCSLEKCKLFMCDEIQGATSDRMQNLITSVNAIRNIGFTATDKNFFSKSEKVLTALFGDRLCEMDYIDAEAINAVVPGVVYFMETSDMARSYSGIDNKMKYGIKMNDDRNRLIGSIAAAVPDKWQCLTFVDHIADHLVEVYKYMPSGTKFVHRESSKKRMHSFALSGRQQKAVIQDYTDNKFKHLIATDAFRAGVSVDNIRCVIQCAGGCSEVEVLQEAFRGSRIMTEDVRRELDVPPKTHFVLIDFTDNHDDALANMSKARRKVYAEQGWEIRDVTCVEEIDWEYHPKKQCPASTKSQTSKQEKAT